MNSIFVTGATGNVGSEVARLLHAAGQPVRVGVRPAALAGYRVPSGIEATAFDFADPATHAPALRGVRRLFLMRPPAISDTKRFINPVIDAARAAGVEQIVFLSLLGAERLRVVPHARVESYLAGAGVPWTFLRPSFFMQNLSTTHRDEIRAGEIPVPAGGGRTSLIDIRDVAAAAARVLSEEGHSNAAYALTGVEALDYHQVAQLLSAELGRPILYRRPSIIRFVRQMRARGLAWPIILVMAGIYTTARLGLASAITPDSAHLLSRQPITMRQFVHDYRGCWL
jgi:uncharacterized protein YbjT (DUF2867 family)